jgi:hypothetical protein
MTDKPADKSEFLYPRSRYHGEFTPENLVFNANLQEFAQRVSYICNLETSGKMPPGEAYNRIKELWTELDVSKHELRIGDDPERSE